MNVVKHKCGIDEQLVPITTANTYEIGELVDLTTGKATPADSSTGNLWGICQEKVTSDDDRYSDGGYLSIDRLREGDQIVMDVDGTTALADAVVGTRYELSDSQTADLDTSAADAPLRFVGAKGSRGIFEVVNREGSN